MSSGQSTKEAILALLRRGGKSNRQIARETGKDERTVRRYKAEIGETPEPVACVQNHFVDPPASRPKPLFASAPPFSPASSTPIRVAVLGDLHDDPNLTNRRFRWLGKWLADVAPDRIVQIGDIADLESLSSHAGNETESGKYKPRFMADMDSLSRAMDLLSEPMARAGINARKDITLGNHEARLWKYEDNHPESAGMLQRDFMNVVNSRGWAAHEYGATIHIGGVGFTHAPFSKMGKPIGGENAAKTVARLSSCDMVFGHTHAGDVAQFQRIGGPATTVIDTGCSLEEGYIASYARHTRSGWRWRVHLLEIFDGQIKDINITSMATIQRRYS